jgi:hypothetical protein
MRSAIDQLKELLIFEPVDHPEESFGAEAHASICTAMEIAGFLARRFP